MTEVGESVAPIPPGVNISTSSGAIVAIADMNSLEAEVDVNESNVAQLQPNQPAEITVQAIPNHTYKGVLRQVIPTADRTKATVTVKVSILDKDKYLKPEMSCNVTFLEPQKQTQKRQRAAATHHHHSQGGGRHPRWQVHGLYRSRTTSSCAAGRHGSRLARTGYCEAGIGGFGDAGQQSSAEAEGWRCREGQA